jgi:hypothetical protein
MENSTVKNIISQVQHNYDAGKDDSFTIEEVKNIIKKEKTSPKFLVVGHKRHGLVTF